MSKEVLKVTGNGVRIYSYKNPSLHSFHISLFVKSGCMYEADSECGITHFFEHISIRNVNRIFDMQLYSMLDRYGLEFNASTFSEMVQFFVTGATPNFRYGAKIISEALSSIVLDKAEIDAERRRIKAEIRESDDKSSLASFTSKIVFEGTPLANSIVGTNRAVDGINRKGLEALRKKILTSDNIFFYVTGNFSDADIDALASLVESKKIFEGEGNNNIAPVPKSFGHRPCKVFVKNSDYTMVRFTFDIDMRRVSVPECDLIYDMLLSGYNSKLFIEMSEKRGIFYDTNGATERYSNIGTMYFSYELKDKDIYDAVSITVDILNSLKNASASECECMKAGYVDNAYMLYDDARELNFTFAYDNHVMNQGYSDIEERKRAYEAVTPEALRRVASEIFRASALTLTVKGNKKRIDTIKLEEIIRRLG